MEKNVNLDLSADIKKLEELRQFALDNEQFDLADRLLGRIIRLEAELNANIKIIEK